jgi:hypothetical protein
MVPEIETAASADAPGMGRAKRLRRKGRRSAGGEASLAADQPAQRIRQLLASIKAEQEESQATPSDRVRTIEWLRRFLAVREQERAAWACNLAELQGCLEDAHRAARAAETALDQAAIQHRRAIADLKLLHDHQRSIWELERRRLEISAGSLEGRRRARLPITSPLSVLASLCLIAVAALALASDSGSQSGASSQHIDDTTHAAVVWAGRG